MFEIDKEGMCTYINNKANVKWQQWKQFKDLTEKELREINLATPSKKYIILDKDLKGFSEEDITKDYNKAREKLFSMGLLFFLGDRSPNGWHIFIPFKNLENLDPETILELRKIYIKQFNCDLAKASLNGVISIPGRPHFKTNLIYNILDNIPGLNTLKDTTINQAKIRSSEILEKSKNNITLEDNTFKNYFIKDPFFLFLNSLDKPLPEGMGKNNIILKNLAIASVKSGLEITKIQEIITNLIKNIMPDKNYLEFLGWYKKAANGELKEYNLYEINSWVKTFFSKEIYDLKAIPLENLTKDKIRSKLFISDKQFEETPIKDTEWLVNGWIAKGDICGIVGKQSSFKTTLVLHMIYAISEGKLVFNTYNTEKCKILYLNEENHKHLFLKMVRRVKKGLDLENIKGENVYFCNMNNLSLNKEEDIIAIIDFVVANEIDVIVFDSFRRFFIGKENEADVISNIMNRLKIIRSACKDCTIINIHHSKKGVSEDERDVARGSSDWGNSLDSEISFKRKLNTNTVILNHIKNRSGPEISGKLLQLDMADDKTYVWQVGDSQSLAYKKSKPEACANRVCQFLEDNKIKAFSRIDLKVLEDEFPYDTITKALRILKIEGVLNEIGNGKRLSYIYNNLSQNEQDEQEKL